MIDPTEGPLRGWYDIHQALRVELAELVGFLRTGLAPDVWSDLEAPGPELANA